MEREEGDRTHVVVVADPIDSTPTLCDDPMLYLVLFLQVC
jgi:hypothetical protein